MRPIEHPWWCDRKRCTVGSAALLVGEHRSEVVTAKSAAMGGALSCWVEQTPGRAVVAASAGGSFGMAGQADLDIPAAIDFHNRCLSLLEKISQNRSAEQPVTGRER